MIDAFGDPGPDVVFTALFGGYERLNEQPVAHESGARFVCFTDDRALTSDTWEIQVVDPFLRGDSSRSSRLIKTLAFRDFGPGARSLYIDNSVRLTRDPVGLLAEWLDGSDIAMIPHSSRGSVADEFTACFRSGLDSPARLKEQRAYYAKHLPAALSARPLWGGMIARRNSAEVESLMKTWFALILRFSRRDQLSLPAASLMTGVPIRAVDELITESPWHVWPVVSHRRNMSRITTVRGRLRHMAGRTLGRGARRGP